MSPSTPYPVILCGATEAIAQSVISGLKPEYEVIHLILSAASGIAELPSLFSPPYHPPPSATTTQSSLSTKKYSSPAVAVILGGSYVDEDIAGMRAACAEKEGVVDVPWLRPDLEKPRPLLGPAYGRAMVERVRAVLAEVIGREGKGGVVYY